MKKDAQHVITDPEIKTEMLYQYTLIRVAKSVAKSLTPPNTGEDVGQPEPSFNCWWEC